MGASFPILENTRPALPHLESCWLASLRTFSCISKRINSSHRIVHPPIATDSRRLHNGCYPSIESVFTCADSPSKLLQAIPSSRHHIRYHKCGRQILGQSKLCRMSSLLSGSTSLLHIHQERPSEAEWTLWQKANLERLFSDSPSTFRTVAQTDSTTMKSTLCLCVTEQNDCHPHQR